MGEMTETCLSSLVETSPSLLNTLNGESFEMASQEVQEWMQSPVTDWEQYHRGEGLPHLDREYEENIYLTLKDICKGQISPSKSWLLETKMFGLNSEQLAVLHTVLLRRLCINRYCELKDPYMEELPLPNEDLTSTLYAFMDTEYRVRMQENGRK